MGIRSASVRRVDNIGSVSSQGGCARATSGVAKARRKRRGRKMNKALTFIAELTAVLIFIFGLILILAAGSMR